MGAQLPHYLARRPAQQAGGGHNFTDIVLRMGEVVQAHYPDDPTNQSKKQMEYTVNVQYRQSNRQVTVSSYRCTVADGLGGIADSSRQTFRVSSGDRAGQTLGDGARVLILCPNGEKNSAVIIAGVRNEQITTNDPPRLVPAGQRLKDFVFNGVHVNINDDGELLLQVSGATKNDGSPDANRDQNNHGTKVQIQKNGSFTITDNNGQSIIIDAPNKAIHIGAANEDTAVQNSWTLQTGKDTRINASGNFSAVATGDAQLAGATVHIGSPQASENLVLGQKLMTALSDLINSVFLDNQAAFARDISQAPEQLMPQVVLALQKWLKKWVTDPNLPLLADKKFTEK
jgi:hypothetical protein